MKLTGKRLCELLNYYPETGIFKWRIGHGRKKYGQVAGYKHHRGYIAIEIDGIQYAAHRLAWFYMTCSWPDNQIDHINLDRSDNRWENLRPATNGQNCANRRPFGKSGLKGAVLNKNWKWHSQITHNKKCISLGYYNTAEEAHAVYAAKAKELHGEYVREK